MGEVAEIQKDLLGRKQMVKNLTSSNEDLCKHLKDFEQAFLIGLPLMF